MAGGYRPRALGRGRRLGRQPAGVPAPAARTASARIHVCARPLHSTDPVRQSSQPYTRPPPSVESVSSSGLPRWVKTNGKVATRSAIGPVTRTGRTAETRGRRTRPGSPRGLRSGSRPAPPRPAARSTPRTPDAGEREDDRGHEEADAHAEGAPVRQSPSRSPERQTRSRNPATTISSGTPPSSSDARHPGSAWRPRAWPTPSRSPPGRSHRRAGGSRAAAGAPRGAWPADARTGSRRPRISTLRRSAASGG